jgi:acetyl-CoA carboxylase biotin carboxyl carrier protein
MDLNKIKAILELFENSTLSKMDLQERGLKICMEKGGTVKEIKEEVKSVAAVKDFCEKEKETVYFNNLTEVKSPIVGVFYQSQDPDSPPLVSKGSHVKKGDVLCIIEAMKVMNEIIADKDGEIVDICVTNGQLVEFSQVLFRMK